MIELIVAMTIFIVLTSIMLLDYNGMNSRITLDTLAQQIGQWVRQTQVSAMSIKHTSASAGIFPGYGLHFDRNAPDQFVFFADLDNDKKYKPLGVGEKCGDVNVECEQAVKLQKGNTIEKLCSELATPPQQASPECGTLSKAVNFDIIFTRPDPDAFIGGEYSAGNYAPSSRALIYVTSAKGYERSIEVWVTGQVSVK